MAEMHNKKRQSRVDPTLPFYAYACNDCGAGFPPYQVQGRQIEPGMTKEGSGKDRERTGYRGQGIGVRGQRIKIATGYALAMTEEGGGKENGGVKLVLTRMRIVTAASCIRLLQG